MWSMCGSCAAGEQTEQLTEATAIKADGDVTALVHAQGALAALQAVFSGHHVSSGGGE